MVFAADEYYLHGRTRAAPRLRTTRASRSTRTGSAWLGRSPRRSPDPTDAWARGGAARILRQPSTPRRPRATAPHARTALAGGEDRASGRRPDRRLRRQGAPTASGVASAAPTSNSYPVANEFFGGNIGVAGLLDRGRPGPGPGGGRPAVVRCLLPDACLNEGRFLDGMTLADLPRPVEVVPDATVPRCGVPSTALSLPPRGRGVSGDGRGGRAPQRRKVLAGQPDRRGRAPPWSRRSAA